MSKNERGFEDAIERSLLGDGYTKSSPENFDRALGLDTAELFAFIGATQVKSWDALVARGYGGDVGAAQRGFARRLASEIDARGTVDVLRHGVADFGVTIQLAFFRPAHNLTPELQQKYLANRVTVTRQLKYDEASEKSLDVVLLVNGLPTATIELKNPLTGQNFEHAITQYRQDRDPANVTLSRRALVHFAVDPDRASMTTKLEGLRTRFLPFNLGTGGAGGIGGAGNPPNPAGHRTSYLWELVWQRDSWLDLLARFIHVVEPETRAAVKRAADRAVIFPRLHQLDAVRKLEAATKASGAGRNYLVQHSAGSGKSNTIAWLSHRLSNLHNSSNKKVFDKVIVITDRVVLDKQLQDTIYQFEHARGVVVKIDQDSAQLAGALLGEQAKIIITTLQKFPFVLGKLADAPARNYAVIVDEAHSSQTGEGAKELRAALTKGQNDDDLLDELEKEQLEVEEREGDGEDRLARLVAGRGRQKNISFYAFTATPKAKTLELFGDKIATPDGDRFVPFHLYSMRQAIEEGFILDVLANYTTYATYWKIEKAVEDDPEVDKSKAKTAIARFVQLHPTNLAQKAEVIVEHFRQHVAAKIGGKAKAMVVTSSRVHAVRYKQAIDRYIRDKGYANLKALVAFSGTVVDEGGSFTEANMNGFPDGETKDRFATGEYQVLIVAEKFQTGFDQPLLHTMYVDKALTGLNAVQTLSRLNRIHAEKSDTFVLDFRNSLEDIVEAFAPWYERTQAIPTDVNLLYDIHREFLNHPVIHVDEIPAALDQLLAGRGAKNHDLVYATLDPALTRFEALGKDDQQAFRDLIAKFISVYGFIAQIVNYTDKDREGHYVYARALESRLPRDSSGSIDIGSDVVLTHLRTEMTHEGSGELPGGSGDVKVGFSGGKEHEIDKENLSKIIDELNERFGLDLDESDQLLFDQFEQEWEKDPEIVAIAKANDFDNFRLVFERMFLATILKRVDDNEEIFKRILDDEAFQALIKEWYAKRVFDALNKQSR